MSAEITIDIDVDGTVIIDGVGFEGKTCHDALAEYMRAVGNEKTSNRKAEFYQKTQKIGQQNKVGG